MSDRRPAAARPAARRSRESPPQPAQHSPPVAHAERQPIALTLAGAPELAGPLLSSGTFLERMARNELGMLSNDETDLALLEPANTRGRIWEPSALDLICIAAAGYPYFVQLGGDHAWEHAHGVKLITVADAQHAANQRTRGPDRADRKEARQAPLSAHPRARHPDQRTPSPPRHQPRRVESPSHASAAGSRKSSPAPTPHSTATCPPPPPTAPGSRSR